MKNKKTRSLMSAAALLLALSVPPAAYGQSDGFFNNADGVRDGSGGSWNDINGDGNGGAAWNGMEDETPVGGGLLVLTAAGVCYAGIKRFKNIKIQKLTKR